MHACLTENYDLEVRFVHHPTFSLDLDPNDFLLTKWLGRQSIKPNNEDKTSHWYIKVLTFKNVKHFNLDIKYNFQVIFYSILIWKINRQNNDWMNTCPAENDGFQKKTRQIYWVQNEKSWYEKLDKSTQRQRLFLRVSSNLTFWMA